MEIANTPAVQDGICLYFFPGTRAVRARWMLEELGLPYELRLVDLHQGAHKRDEYLAIHPLGKVPALKIGKTVLFESLAICLYLADYYPQSALAPEIASPDRAEYYKWMAFSTGTLEPAIIEQSRRRKSLESGVNYIDMGPALTPFKQAMAYIDNTLASRMFLLGNNFTAADLMIGSLLIWADGMELLTDFPHAKTWVDRLRHRPAYQRIKPN